MKNDFYEWMITVMALFITLMLYWWLLFWKNERQQTWDLFVQGVLGPIFWWTSGGK